MDPEPLDISSLGVGPSWWPEPWCVTQRLPETDASATANAGAVDANHVDQVSAYNQTRP